MPFKLSMKVEPSSVLNSKFASPNKIVSSTRTRKLPQAQETMNLQNFAQQVRFAAGGVPFCEDREEFFFSFAGEAAFSVVSVDCELKIDAR